MTFSKYYSSLSDCKKKALAKQVGTKMSYFKQLSSGFRSPSKKMMGLIEEKTNGSVTILSWFTKPSTEKAA